MWDVKNRSGEASVFSCHLNISSIKALVCTGFFSVILASTLLPLLYVKSCSVPPSIYLSVCLPVSLCVSVWPPVCLRVSLCVSGRLPCPSFPSVAWASVAYHEMNALFRPGFRCGVPTGWWLSPRPQAPAYLQLRLDGGHVPWLFHGKLHWGGELRQSGKKSRMELPLSFEKGSSVRVLNPAKFPVVTHN